MLKHLVGIICLCLLVSGCVSKGKFVMDDPLSRPTENSKGRIVALLTPVADQRPDKQELDKIYDGDISKDIQLILQKNLLGTNIFDNVIAVPEAGQGVQAAFVIEPTLQILKWEVPGYESMVNKVFIVSLFTGGLGGMIYGSTDIEVKGKAAMHFRVTNTANNSIWEKSYESSYQEQKAKMVCDTPETKVRITRESLDKIFQSLDSDLKDLLLTEMSVGVSPQN